MEKSERIGAKDMKVVTSKRISKKKFTSNLVLNDNYYLQILKHTRKSTSKLSRFV